ncbi:MAG: class I SAM-dependent methyltransferase [Dehalococcoidia bacterium]
MKNDPREAWNEGAAAWDEFVESGADYYRTQVHGPALLEACGEVAGLRVLDLGSGQGWFSRRLAERGAKVSGVELAESQLANARRHEEERPLGIEYHLLDASAAAEHFAASSFDLVTACMSLQDMEEPAEAMAAAHGLLTDEGRLIFSTVHPFTDAAYREWERDAGGEKLSLKVDRYFDSGVRALNWNMDRLIYHWQTPQWRRTLTEWAQLCSSTGYLIRALYEPRPSEEQVRREPDLDDAQRLPFFLVFDLVKVR